MKDDEKALEAVAMKTMMRSQIDEKALQELFKEICERYAI